jgi:hypothetical protein
MWQLFSVMIAANLSAGPDDEALYQVRSLATRFFHVGQFHVRAMILFVFR